MKHLVMGTAGHVDHGKTALIKALTNIDCDTHKEEKKRGITINLGFSHLDLPSGNSIGIIDVPGHKDFINTMVSGASGIDFVMLVIAADSGIMPQTTEHLNIIKSLGIDKGFVALNKTDLVDDEIVELASIEISELLEQNNLNFPIVPVSAHTGKGLDTIIHTIEKIIPEIPEKEKFGAFRMYIDRLFTVKGAGSVVTGSVLSGSVKLGDELFLQPFVNKALKVKTIQRHGKNVDSVEAGDRAALNLSGLKKEDFKRGMIISDKIHETSEMIDVAINLFDNAKELKLWSTVLFHAGTYESQARMHLLDKDTVKAGETVIAQIHLEKPGIFFNKDKFVLRNSSGDKTIAGGIIIDNKPLHHRKRKPELIEKLTKLYQNIENSSQTDMLVDTELRKERLPMELESLAERINVDVLDLKNNISSNSNFAVYQSGNSEFVVLQEFENEISNFIITELKNYHKKYPVLEEGVGTNYFTGKLSNSKNKLFKKYIELLLQKLNKKLLIEKKNGTWILQGHKPEIDENTQNEIDWLKKIFIDYQLQKPVLHDIEKLANERGISKEKLKTLLKYLENTQFLIKHNQDYIAGEIVNNVKNMLKEHLKSKPEGINLSEFRQLTSCTKKTIPLLIGILESQKFIKSHPEGTHTIIQLLS